jgi:hypothetical protein
MSETDRKKERNFNLLKALVKRNFTCALKRIEANVSADKSRASCFFLLQYNYFWGVEVFIAQYPSPELLVQYQP